METGADTKTALEVQSKGARTRERILDLAYDSIVRKGFAATSIDELIEGAGISKSGFFYHFKDKTDLARALLDRYLQQTEAMLDELEARARELHEDPLHALLIYLKLYSEKMAQVFQEFPGCLVASITYQDHLFDPGVRERNRQGMLAWRTRYLRWLEEIAERYPPKAGVPLVDLADHMSVVADGSIVLAKGVGDFDAMRRQVAIVRETLRLLFGA